MIQKEDVKLICDMTLEELEDVQVALLYEWEEYSWIMGRFQMSPGDLRRPLYEVLAKEIQARNTRRSICV